MAKVILSALLDSLDGKLAGSVFQMSQGGLQIRTRVSPRNPATGPQQLRRSNWSTFSKSWTDLTTAEQDSWRDNAPMNFNGIGFFLSQNAKVTSADQPILNFYTVGTTIFSPQITITALDATHFDLEHSWIPGILQANQYMNLFVTKPFKSGSLFISPGDYVLLMSFPPGTDILANYSIITEYNAKYPAVQDGQNVGVKAYVINVATGISSNDAYRAQVAPL